MLQALLQQSCSMKMISWRLIRSTKYLIFIRFIYIDAAGRAIAGIFCSKIAASMLQHKDARRGHFSALGADGQAELRCLFKTSRTNRQCIRGTRPFLRCRQAGRRAPSPWCGFGSSSGAAVECLGWQDPVSARGYESPAARCRPAADRRCCGAVVSGSGQCDREDVAEFHVHHGRAVLVALVRGAGGFEMYDQPRPVKFAST